MNFIGKILVVLIMVAALAFMTFAVMVYNTHKNWYQEVSLTPQQATALGKQPGLKFQLDDLKAQVANITEEKSNAATAFSSQLEDAKKLLQEASQGRNALTAERDQLNLQVATLTRNLQEATATMKIAQDNETSLRDEVVKLRDDIRKFQKERDDKDVQLVKTVDELEKKRTEAERLSATNTELLTLITRYDSVLQENDINPYVTTEPPTDLAGVVVVEHDGKLAELNVGTDDGLRVGHFVDVVRGGSYVGRLQVIRADSNTSVGQVLDDYTTRRIQEGDNVRSRIQ